MKVLVVLILICFFTFGAVAKETKSLAGKSTSKSKPKKKIRFPGSREWQVRENKIADKQDLSRIKDQKMTKKFVQKKLLVPMKQSRAVQFRKLKSDRRFTRPWVAQFIQNCALAFSKQFKKPTLVSSLVRDQETQKSLRKDNSNAAAFDGDHASLHLRGNTWDWSKFGMTSQQIDWVRQYLNQFVQRKEIAVIEERVQPCFHITVHKPAKKLRRK